jgi:hypothetical protein
MRFLSLSHYLRGEGSKKEVCDETQQVIINGPTEQHSPSTMLEKAA